MLCKIILGFVGAVICIVTAIFYALKSCGKYMDDSWRWGVGDSKK